MANRLIEGILNRIKKGQLYNRENWMVKYFCDSSFLRR